MRGTIDDSAIFFDEDSLPAISSSINDLFDPSKARGVRSTTINIAATAEAKRVLGSEFMMQVESKRRPKIRIGNGSVDVLNSDLVVKSKSRDIYECVAIGGNASWFEYAKRTKLRKVDYGVTDVVDAAMQQATWTTEGGLVHFPLVDFGTLYAQISTYDVQPKNLRPAVRVFEAIRIAMQKGGWRVQAKGLFANVCRKPYILEPKATPSIPIPEPYPGIFDDDTSLPDADAPYFIPLTDGLLTVTPVWTSSPPAHVAALNPFDVSGDGYSFRVAVYDFTDKRILSYYDTPPHYFATPEYEDILDQGPFNDVPVLAGHQIALTVFVLGLDGDPIPLSVILFNKTHFDLNSGAQVKTLSVDSVYSFNAVGGDVTIQFDAGMRVDIAQALPDWTVMDLITELANAASIVFNTPSGGNVIEMWFEREFFSRPTHNGKRRDWTMRMDHTDAPQKKIQDIARRYILKWGEDEGDRFLNRANYLADAEFGYASSITETDGIEEDFILENKCAPTINGLLLGGINAPILRQLGEETSEDNFDRTTRFLLSHGMAEGDWKFDGVDLTEYPRSYFSATDSPLALPFGNANIYNEVQPVSSRFEWKERLLRLRDSRILEADLFIYDHEIQDFDHGMPTLVDDGSGPAWYYVQEIRQHKFGQSEPTRCTLVQIQGKEVNIPVFVNPPVQFPVIPVLADVGDFNNDFSDDFFNHG